MYRLLKQKDEFIMQNAHCHECDSSPLPVFDDCTSSAYLWKDLSMALQVCPYIQVCRLTKAPNHGLKRGSSFVHECSQCSLCDGAGELVVRHGPLIAGLLQAAVCTGQRQDSQDEAWQQCTPHGRWVPLSFYMHQRAAEQEPLDHTHKKTFIARHSVSARSPSTC